ncbi:MAG: tRNA dimethylallyltransferase [Candidatus Jorgensenbacteria bacterium GW2011_GWA1_48_13]|uniref:tRNA dimethylallyltransferase n=2 Tax=Candidatus Joergenseniibacteriota TaxID=1752739 RepID=A0A0G1Z7R7_9BACT|nr:MAG: tRNA dimethylallyltransferase [Candidatus Jorgensenbacteria bacterium GW2011_GWA1_48_13]KKU99340.1 MAG: tRNA delta(2)-isopentenylpyrophosphate transferase, tRNA dimethylallyltransferase [Candidatus Jorgensenbacteria bacterium GW2011_GWC1_48_8]KKW15024.1 MAG: tRNA dimethylallyltransferase [Candidatus Jorgensenbacteria bacterium GW2011_GWB1_50_10]
MSNKRPKIIAIAGPTASGKTALAIALAKRLRGEVISADSRQIYRGMDIGTGKDKTYPQFLIDTTAPKQVWNAVKYKRATVKKIREILKRGKLPILVGGTGLYIKAILENLKIPAVKPDKKLREELEEMTTEELEEKLSRLDPEAAKTASKNKRRIIRALEVILKTGNYFSSQRQKGKPLFNALVIGIKVPREELYERINKRVNEQIKRGLVQEVKKLVKKYGENAYALQNSIAYKELLPYLRGETTLEKSIEDIKRNSRRYARRQITWFKMQPDIHWVDSKEKAEKLVNKFLNLKN